MALYDKVRENMQKMQSGQLGGTSSEELKKQADAAGRTAPPVTPLEGSALGASPDAAKMAGTPNNKLNALQQSFRQETDKIQTTLRQQQARTQATEAEAAKKERAKQLEANLAGAPERLQKVAREAFTKAEAPIASLTLDTTKFQATLPTGVDKTRASTLAGKAINGTIGVDELVELETMLGKEITPEVIKVWNPAISDSVAAGVAATLPNNVLASQLYTTPEDKQAAADALGVTVDALDTMTFKQIKDRTQAIQAEEFSKTERLRRNAVDPNVSPAERAAARSALKDQGAIGLSATERDVASLEDRIANGDKVMFDGKETDIEEMLSDDFLKGTIKGALEDPKKMEALKKTEPDFAKMIETNRAALEAKMAKENPALTVYADIQKANKSMNSLPNGLKLNDNVMSMLVPGWGKPSATKMTVPPLIQALQSDQLNSDARTRILANLTTLSAYPQLGPELANLTSDQIFSLGLDNKDKVDRVASNLQDSKELYATGEGSMTDAQISAMIGLSPGTNLASLEKELPGLWSQAAISDPTSELNRFLNMVDSNRDGKVDSPGQIASNAKKLLGNITSLKDAVNAGIGINKPSIQPSAAATKAAPYLQDGTLSQEDKAEMVKTMTPEELETLASEVKGKDLGVQELIQGSADRMVNNLRPSHTQNRVLANPKDVYANDKQEINDTLAEITNALNKTPLSPVHKQALQKRQAQLEAVKENFTFARRQANRLLEHAKHWASALGRTDRGRQYDRAVAEIEDAMQNGNVEAVQNVVTKYLYAPGGNMTVENSSLVKDVTKAKTDPRYGGW